ncbi:MAG: LysR family transcriptional regulator [Proteobacteria bacterium]|nr:LysR family transcriptional regulator [Pseudomonadota bacterium]
MTLQQLRFICEIVRHQCNVSRAAEALGMSQPGLSRQVRDLEREIGIDVFVRASRRFLRLTEPGVEVHRIAARMLLDAAAIEHVGQDFSDVAEGTLTIATTHTQARYRLPPVIQRFARRFPDVGLRIRQGTPSEAAAMVVSGTADLCIATEPPEPTPSLVFLPCYRLPRVILTPVGHPLVRERKLTLAKLARYPLITYDFAFVSRSRILAAFAREGLAPSIVLNAIDADVIKTYVELGMGIAILPALAFDRRRDKALRALDAGGLFEPSLIQVGLRRGDYLRGFGYTFIELFAPALDRAAVEHAVARR